VANTIRDFILIFASILYEAMPFIVLGALIAGILEELSPRQAFAFMAAVSVALLTIIFAPLPLAMRVALGLTGAAAACLLLLRCQGPIDAVLAFLGRHRFTALAMSGFLGLIMPMCECGIIPVMRRLLRKGMPLSCCVTYMLCGPIINIVVLLSTYAAFAGMETNVDSSGRSTYQAGGLTMVFLRGGMGWVVAFVTGLVVEFQHRKYGDELLAPLARPPKAIPGEHALDDDVDKARKPVLQRIGNASETALHDFVDIMVFLILGALLSAFFRTMFTSEQVEEVAHSQPILAILAMMALAVVLCLCSEADAFVAAALTSIRPSAKVAFLVLGPMMDFKLYLLYLRVFRPRLIWTIIPCVAIQVFLYSLLLHFVWETYAPIWYGTSAP
jgi:uncharacterized membrane protein YraQ (UPF0718 family)